MSVALDRRAFAILRAALGRAFLAQNRDSEIPYLFI